MKKILKQFRSDLIPVFVLLAIGGLGMFIFAEVQHRFYIDTPVMNHVRTTIENYSIFPTLKGIFIAVFVQSVGIGAYFAACYFKAKKANVKRRKNNIIAEFKAANDA